MLDKESLLKYLIADTEHMVSNKSAYGNEEEVNFGIACYNELIGLIKRGKFNIKDRKDA